MKLKDNQAALILELSGEREITVHLDSPLCGGLPREFCQRIAERLLYDENFRASLYAGLEKDLVN
ncbi:MAG: hypothetical protein ACWGOX_09775 [Desulforhopalus sp.]